MNFTQLLILQFIAHFLTDFTFQPDKKAEEKNRSGFKSKFLKWHILISFLLSWLLSFQINFIWGAMGIALIHWLTDGLKRRIINNRSLTNYAFFIDQAIHLTCILSVVYLFSYYFELKPFIAIPAGTKFLLIIAGYVFCTKPANILIKEVFKVFDIKIDNKGNDELPNAGKLIGIIERFLVLAFIILNQFEAVGFLIAAKSILRFKDNEPLKTEYVLIGTMLSFGIALASGIIINLG